MCAMFGARRPRNAVDTQEELRKRRANIFINTLTYRFALSEFVAPVPQEALDMMIHMIFSKKDLEYMDEINRVFQRVGRDKSTLNSQENIIIAKELGVATNSYQYERLMNYCRICGMDFVYRRFKACPYVYRTPYTQPTDTERYRNARPKLMVEYHALKKDLCLRHKHTSSFRV